MLDNYLNETKCPWEIYQKLDKALIRHCENVALLAKLLYELALKENLFPGQMSKDQLIHIKNAVIYHDIGKSRIPFRLLNRKGSQNDLERMEVECHVSHGLDIFAPLLESRHASRDTEIFLETVLQAISHHHERFNGTGYPGGMRGDEIPVIGRICGLCDYYDVLASNRPDRGALPHSEVLEMIQAESGKMFDPVLVRLFAANHHKFQQCRASVGGEDEKSDNIRYKKRPGVVAHTQWEQRSNIVAADIFIDTTGLRAKQTEKQHCIQAWKNKSLIIKSAPRVTHENLRFHL